MHCLNCGRTVDGTRVFVLPKLHGTYCLQCRPLAVVTNGRRAMVEARSALDAAAEDGATATLITVRRHRKKTLYEIRLPRGR